MHRLDLGEYTCEKDERIQIEFFCSPNRNNVRISHSFDGRIFKEIPETSNSIRFKMNDDDVNLHIQCAFILTGSCDCEVAVVDGGEDIVKMSARGGRTDTVTLTFHAPEN